MLSLLLLPILLVSPFWRQNPSVAADHTPVVAVSFRWFKDRQAADKVVMSARPPQPTTIEPTNSISRDARTDGTKPEPDPNREKIETRSASLDQIAQSASESHRIDGFTYEIKFKNLDSRQALKIFWEYQFKETVAPGNTSRHRFACGVRLKPDKEKVIQIFSTLSPGAVINVKNLSKGANRQFDESVVVDRIEFEDGSVWQRPDWNVEEAKAVVSKRDRAEVCRSF